MTATILPLWQREGTCQPERCGSACCRFVGLEVNPIYLRDPDLATWAQLHGIRLSEHGGRVVARIPLECSALLPNGQCALYGQPERPRICDAFPMAPASLLGVEEVCTYRFTEAS